jgi:hypothetical protein
MCYPHDVDAQAQLSGFIDRYSPDVAADARRALAFMADRLPTATRLVYDNYNALVVGFGAGPRASDIVFSIALYRRYVTLFFARGVELADPQGVLEGEGKGVRHVKLRPVSRLQTAELGALIDAALAIADPPLPATGGGELIIKSISAKQRPRRPAA